MKKGWLPFLKKEVRKLNRYKKYAVCIGIGAREAIEYRLNYLIGLISCIMPMVLQCFLWTAIYGGAAEPSMHKYTYYEMITYTLLAGLVTRIASAGFQYEMASDIKTGALNKFLVQPVSYFFYRVSCFIGKKSQQLVIMIVFVAGVLVFSNKVLSIGFRITDVLFFLTALVLGIMLNFLVFYCLSILAFWFFEVTSFFGTFNLVSVISGGGVVPVEFFGSTVNRIINCLPFKYIIYFPISIINGRIADSDIAKGIIIQLVWITFFGILAPFLWRRGIKKYVAVGG